MNQSILSIMLQSVVEDVKALPAIRVEEMKLQASAQSKLETVITLLEGKSMYTEVKVGDIFGKGE